MCKKETCPVIVKQITSFRIDPRCLFLVQDGEQQTLLGLYMDQKNKH